MLQPCCALRAQFATRWLKLAERATAVYPTKQPAVNRAREIARNQSAELWVHGKGGHKSKARIAMARIRSRRRGKDRSCAEAGC